MASRGGKRTSVAFVYNGRDGNARKMLDVYLTLTDYSGDLDIDGG
jgi:hypothetical protein